MQQIHSDKNDLKIIKDKQFTTFYISNHLYGIDVIAVQEVTPALSMTKVPHSPNYVQGLINLRGQISTAISLRNLFNLDKYEESESMNVVCRWEENLFSFVVDRIGDVMNLSESQYEEPPDTLSEHILKYISGVYKTDKALVTIIDVNKVIQSILQIQK